MYSKNIIDGFRTIFRPLLSLTPAIRSGKTMFLPLKSKTASTTKNRWPGRHHL